MRMINHYEKLSNKMPSLHIKISSEKNTIIELRLLKAFLNINTERDDELLSHLLNFAIEYAEWYMERSLRVQTWSTSFKNSSKIQLKFGPIIKIEEVKQVRSNFPPEGFEIIDPQNYAIDPYSGELHIKRSSGFRLDIKYKAGYLNPDDINQQIKQGIIAHVASVYSKRDFSMSDSLKSIHDYYLPFKELRLVL